jgi:SAM-dependent methyltransferase
MKPRFRIGAPAGKPCPMNPPRLFAPAVVRAHKRRAGRGFAEAAFLHKRSAADLAERLEAIPRRFERVLVLGSPGIIRQEFAARPDVSNRLGALVEADVSGAAIEVDHDRLPFADGQFDLIVSPLFLHWANDLPGALTQLRQALRPDGLLLASLFGTETLHELRHALLAADTAFAGGAGPRVAPFADMRDAAHLLQRAGLALPASDRDVVTVRYRNFLALLYDLRAMGETAPLIDRSPRALSRRTIAHAEAIYCERYADVEGRLVATFEIVTLTGWAPHESQQKPLKPGSAAQRLADALGVKEQSSGEKAGS